MTAMIEVLGYGLMMIAAAAFWIWWGERKDRKKAEQEVMKEHIKEEFEKLKKEMK